MKKTVWILNHYATAMFFDRGGRHYSLAKHLQLKGYHPIIVCSNIRHNSTDMIPIKKGLYTKKSVDGIPFVFIKTCQYGTDKKRRVISMFQYYKRTIKSAESLPRPDVIIGSSVHPLACIAANKLAKKYHCKSICEIRDLWPESIVAYGILARENIIAKILYAGEKWIYKKADAIVMTWAGGYDYIRNHGWGNTIPKRKVTYISNGVDIEKFRKNIEEYPYKDEDLMRTDVIKFVYAGSIRAVNNIGILVKAAQVLEKKSEKRVRILIWGEGDEQEKLSELVKRKGLTNIVFKGSVPKQFVPSILAQADISILHNTSTSLDIYGQSQNKFFEYLAVGHPILMTYTVGHSVCKEQKCGIELEKQTPEHIAEAMQKMARLNEEQYKQYCNRAVHAAEAFDYDVLGDKLIEVIEYEKEEKR